MRAASNAIKNFLAANRDGWTADLITFTLRDGTFVRWTTANLGMIVGGNTYLPGPILGTNMRQSEEAAEVDTYELTLAGGFALAGSTLATQVLRGYFEDARVKIDAVVGAFPGDLSLGVIDSWFEGRISTTNPGIETRMVVKAEDAALNIMLPRFQWIPSCGHSVYDANCGLLKATFTVSGTVAGSPTPTVTSFGSGRTEANNFFNLGVLKFTSGALINQRRAVQLFVNSGGVFTLARPLPSAPVAGVTFDVYPGCNKTVSTCLNIFNNLIAFRGFNHIPTSENVHG